MIWIFSITAFLCIMCAAFAVYRMFQPAPESYKQATRRRFTDIRPSQQVALESAEAMLRQTSFSSISFLDRFLSRAHRLANLQATLDRAGNPMNLGTLILACGALASLGALAGVVSQLGFISIILALVLGYLPIMAVNHIAKKRLAVFETQFPEAVELITRALRAGHSFSSGLRMVADEMSDPAAGEFAKTFEDYTYGKTMNDALNGLVKRVDLADVKFFASAVSLQRETGGNLTEVLDNLGYIVRERFKLQRTVKALSAEGRLSGIILSLMAPAMFGILWLSSPRYLAMALDHPIGQITLVVGAVFEVLGILVIKQLIKMDL